jgi:hypothetical protein
MLAVRAVKDGPDGLWARIRAEADPVRQVALGLEHYPVAISKLDLSNLVSDAFASLTVPRRHVLALVLAPRLLRLSCVNVPTLELLTGILDKLRGFSDTKAHTISTGIGQAKALNAKIARIAKLDTGSGSDLALGNMLMYLLVVEKEDFDPGDLIRLAGEWRELFGERTAAGAA